MVLTSFIPPAYNKKMSEAVMLNFGCDSVSGMEEEFLMFGSGQPG